MIIYLQMIESDEDKSKFEQLYIMYKGLMFHVAMKILKNEFDAEDAVHQAFLSLIENLKKISDVKCPKTRAYIVIITERKAIDIIRSRSKLVDVIYFIIFAIEKIDRYALIDFFYPLEGTLSCLYINCQPCTDRQNRHN